MKLCRQLLIILVFKVVLNITRFPAASLLLQRSLYVLLVARITRVLGVLPEYLGVDRHQSLFAPYDTAATFTVGLQRLKGHHSKIYFK